MDTDTIRDELLSFVGTRKKVRLTRSIPSEPRHNGFILAVGSELVLMQQFHDFYSEGFTVLRISDIAELRYNEYEWKWQSMLEAEGLTDELPVPSLLPLDNWLNLLEFFQLRGDNIIIECENGEDADDDDDEEFFIGKILAIGEEWVAIANFNALGRWDEEPHEVPFEYITKIQFDTPYVNIFSKYLEGPCPAFDRSA